MSGRNSPDQRRARLEGPTKAPITPAHARPTAAPVKRLTPDGEEVDVMAAKLLAGIKELNIQKNIVTAEEFNRYAVLFRKMDHKMTLSEEQDLKDLSNEFVMRFDPYHEIHIVHPQDRTKILLTFPRLFTQMRPAENNMYADFAFSRAAKMATLGLAREHQKAGATAALIPHLEAAQKSNLDLVREGHEIYVDALQAFDKIAHPNASTEVVDESKKDDTPASPPMMDDDDCAIVD